MVWYSGIFKNVCMSEIYTCIMHYYAFNMHKVCMQGIYAHQKCMYARNKYMFETCISETYAC